MTAETLTNNILCHCMNISTETVLKCIKEGCTTTNDVIECTKAGSCCRACHRKIERLINHESRDKEAKSSKQGI